MEAPTAGTSALSTAPTGITAAAPVADGARPTGASEEDLPVGDLASMVQTRADFAPFMKDDLHDIMKGPFGSAFEAPMREFMAHKQRVLDAQHAESDATVHLVGRPLKASRLFIPSLGTLIFATSARRTSTTKVSLTKHCSTNTWCRPSCQSSRKNVRWRLSLLMPRPAGMSQRHAL